MGILDSSLNVLVTFPGKLGDTIFTLSAIRSLSNFFSCKVDFQTSNFCESLIEILSIQPYINQVLIDKKYILNSTTYGCQPWKMNEPSGYDYIFHLGYRYYFGDSILNGKYHLTEIPYIILKNEYGIDLSNCSTDQFLFIPESKNENYVCFHCGKNILIQKDREKRYLIDLWQKIFNELLNEKIFILCSLKEESSLKQFFQNKRILIVNTVYSLAKMIQKSKFFLGTQSLGNAIAEGLKKPRMIFNIYKNAFPIGEKGISFSMEDNVSEKLVEVKKWM